MPVLNRRTMDLTLFACVLALSAIGLVMVYSASSIVAYDRLDDSAYFLKRQAMWIALGLMAMWLAMIRSRSYLRSSRLLAWVAKSYSRHLPHSQSPS